MALRNIRIDEDPILRKKSRNVTEINERLKEVVDDMIETMYEADGVGLAAPQIGILRRIIVIDVGKGPIVLINPVILKVAGSQTGLEGCLSVPGVNEEVQRPNYVQVKYVDLQGKEKIIEGEELLARAICHEIDHLEGILFTDKVKKGDSLMRIVFMGTPDFAYVQLKAIIEAGHEVVAVVTQPDKPNTRGNKIIYSPVKVLALENSIEVLQPTNIKSLDTFQKIQTFNPEVIVAVAYGQLLSQKILEFPKFGCINIHASLLPKYRGSAPIHWSIINGEVETGVTTMYMDIGMDTGDMIYQEKVSIGEDITVGELYDKLAALGASLIIKTLSDIETGIAPREKQDEGKSTYAPLLTKDTGKINWQSTSKEIINLVRGTNPWPVAYTNYAGQKIKVLIVKNHEDSIDSNSKPGTIIEYVKNQGLLVKTGDGAIYLDIIQFPNKKKMSVDTYMLGNTIEIGTVLD